MKVKKTIIVSMICIMLMSTMVYGVNANMYNNIVPDGGVASIGNAILGVIRGVAGTCAAISAVVLGIRYVYSAPGDKAEIKKRMMPFVIGSVLAFGSLTLVDMVYQVSKDLL